MSGQREATEALAETLNRHWQRSTTNLAESWTCNCGATYASFSGHLASVVVEAINDLPDAVRAALLGES